MQLVPVFFLLSTSLLKVSILSSSILIEELSNRWFLLFFKTLDSKISLSILAELIELFIKYFLH